MDQLNTLANKAREEAGDEAAMLFETHAMFVEDEDFCDCMDTALGEGHTAERAVEVAREQFAAMLAAMDDAYMQARAADIKDVARRILNNLMGVVESGINSDEPVILAADDLAPSEAVLSNDGQGIGLFRSEFLYLAASDYPTEEDQFKAYKEVAAAMDGKRVVIRTLDIGADK